VNSTYGKMKPRRPGATGFRVVRIPGSGRPARLVGAGIDLPCAVGKGGISHRKREGDGATPAGRLAVLCGYWRPDRFGVRPSTPLPLAPIRRDAGWCDASGHPAYNRPVRLPFAAGHERMWRDDGLYDLVLVLDWNIRPRARGRGSAIFMHLARPGFEGTAGCVALRRADLVRLLPRLRRGTGLRIG
jgi:L,D-peptidoglycan transpeptidase YkuD (ErfK/YbiS/YcfS/YnhG family)